jgi:hypothetical protein
MRDLMAAEWQQVELQPGTTPPPGLELVVLELRGGSVAGWEHHPADLTALVETLAEGGVPVAVWATAGPLADAGWLGRATVLAASTSSLVTELETVTGRRVKLLEAAAQPRLDRPAGPPHARHGATLVIDGSPDPAASQALQDLVVPAIKPMPAANVLVQGVGQPGGDGLLALQGALGRNVEQREWPVVEGDLADHRVAVDLSALSADAQWTSMAIAASGTPLVGIDGLSRSLPADIAALVPQTSDVGHLRRELVARIQQTELVAREGQRLQRAVLASHTAAHRARAIVAAAGLTAAAPTAQSIPVSAIIPTNRAHELDNILANMGRQSHGDRELVLVLHGLDIDHSELKQRATESGLDNLVVVDAERSLTLGACMNLGVDAASGRYIAKMDDDNFYGAHYLSDLLDAFSYTDAGIVGKWCHYVWLRSTDAVILRYPESEHRSERRIQGGSMLFDGDVARTLRFSDIPRAVDSDILDRAMAEGVTIYSADRFNFVSIRGRDRHTHTWTVADSTFMTKTGRLQFFGDPRPHVSV